MDIEELIKELDRVDEKLRERLRCEVDKGPVGNKVAYLIRARADLQSAITNLLCVRDNV